MSGGLIDFDTVFGGLFYHQKFLLVAVVANHNRSDGHRGFPDFRHSALSSIKERYFNRSRLASRRFDRAGGKGLRPIAAPHLLIKILSIVDLVKNIVSINMKMW